MKCSGTVLPQLYMFQKNGGQVEAFTSHFVFCLGFSRLLSLWFWFSSHHELADKKAGGLQAYIGWGVILAQIVQLLLMTDFFYYYLKSVGKGEQMQLPSFTQLRSQPPREVLPCDV